MKCIKNIFIKILIITFLSISLYIITKFDGLKYLRNINDLEILIKELGMLGPITFISIYFVGTLTTISTLPLTLASGVLFGPIYGILYTVIGASLGMSASFFISRYVAKDSIEKKFNNLKIFKKINEGLKENDWFILAITRLIPIFPFGIQNYLYGLTKISFFKYIFFSTIFILPGTSVYVLLAEAITAGDSKKAIFLSLTASFIFLSITVVGKIIKKKNKKIIDI